MGTDAIRITGGTSRHSPGVYRTNRVLIVREAWRVRGTDRCGTSRNGGSGSITTTRHNPRGKHR
jgi:hypothetical protein